MASLDCILPSNQVLFTKLFNCDLCCNTFETEENFNNHVLEHFQTKNCDNCNKFLIQIGSQWFELHVDDISHNDDYKNDIVVSSLAEVKMEVSDENLESVEEIKQTSEIEFESNTDNFEEETNDFEIESQCNTKSSSEISDHKTDSLKRTRSGNVVKRRKLIEMESHEEISTDNTTEPIHSKRKEKLARIQCRICDRMILKYNFDIHLQKMHVPRIIVPAEPVKCETCGKSFANSGNLKTHQAIHSGTKRFVCSYCGRSFRQLYHLTEHMNAHTGDKPYHCTSCDKKFGRLHILKAHQLVHTGEKPHKCTINGCDRAYAYDIDLKRHRFSAHGIYTKKHICSFCSKVFPENKLLKKHLESHSAGNIRKIPTKTGNDELFG